MGVAQILYKCAYNLPADELFKSLLFMEAVSMLSLLFWQEKQRNLSELTD